MNWTGGSLQRTKTANRGVTQKQKAYFARARMHLQNGPTSPIAPFQPNYLIRNDQECNTCLSPSRTGVPARRNGNTERHVSPHERRSEHASDTHISRKSAKSRMHKSLNGLARAADGERDTTLFNSKKRKHNRELALTDGSLETQLLEKNKKRLLKQRDWVGIAPSKPVNLPFSSIKESSRNDKRRRPERKNIATAMQKKKLDSGYRDNLAGQIPRIHAEGIRVRIGTDALTTHSAQLLEDTQSQASSDLMLFDQEGEGAVQAEEQSNPHPLIAQTDPACTNASLNVEPHHPGYNNNWTCDREVGLDKIATSRSTDYHLVELNTVDQGIAEYGAGDQGVRITHTVEGIARPLDLVFATSNHSTRSRSHSRPANQEFREEEHIAADEGAEVYRVRHASRRSNVDDQPQNKEASAGALRVGEEPWRAFLSIPDNSSTQSTALHGTETRVPHAHSTDRSDRVDHKSWSRHATQGNRTPFSSSAVSSLPSLRHPSARPQDNSFEPEPAPMADMGVDERLWRAFVFGSDDGVSTESQRDASADVEPRHVEYARVVPAASDPVSHTPFDVYSASTGATCGSTKRAEAPQSGSQAISSTASPYGDWGQDGELDERQGSAQGVVQSQSVTHASLQNNVSRNSGDLSSNCRSGTRTSRGAAGRCGYRWDDSLEYAETGRRDGWLQGRPSSIYGVADGSDYGGLDIVDPNMLT